MGQFLSIGIVTRIVASKERVGRLFEDDEEFKTAFEKEFNLTGIYQLHETDDVFLLELKPEIAEQEWIDFIRSFYELRYPEKKYLSTILDALSKETTLQGWLDIAKDKKYEWYQADDYMASFPMESPHPFSYLYVGMSQVILGIDGKILMECYHDLFCFFTRLIRERLSDYRLAESLYVYITG